MRLHQIGTVSYAEDCNCINVIFNGTLLIDHVFMVYTTFAVTSYQWSNDKLIKCTRNITLVDNYFPRLVANNASQFTFMAVTRGQF